MKPKWTTIDYIKKHSRLDYDCENELIELYIISAEDTILNLLNRTYEDLIETYGDVPAEIREATLMLVDNSYSHRSPAGTVQLYDVRYGFDMRIKPYIRLTSNCPRFMSRPVTLGSQEKIVFDAELPDDLTLQDVDFAVTVYNTVNGKSKQFAKDKCLLTKDDIYMVLIDTDELGVGAYMLRLDIQIPDADFPAGYRKEVVKINPHIIVKG